MSNWRVSHPPAVTFAERLMKPTSPCFTLRLNYSVFSAVNIPTICEIQEQLFLQFFLECLPSNQQRVRLHVVEVRYVQDELQVGKHNA